MNIRRSGAYGIAGAAVLGFSMFLPMSTPDWYGIAVLSSASALAGVALYFNIQERKTGQTKRSVGFFALAVLIIILALLCILPLLV